jgi:hypothetical protein
VLINIQQWSVPVSTALSPNARSTAVPSVRVRLPAAS